MTIALAHTLTNSAATAAGILQYSKYVICSIEEGKFGREQSFFRG